MKKVLLDSSLNYYKANLHGHTTESDGVMTPAEVKKLYKNEGYSVIAFTDHEHLIDNSYLNDDGFIALTDVGAEVAERIYERHTLLTEFLVRLGVDRETASADACKIEHHLSDKTFAAIKDHAESIGK